MHDNYRSLKPTLSVTVAFVTVAVVQLELTSVYSNNAQSVAMTKIYMQTSFKKIG